MRLRIAWLGGTTLFALGVALGLLLAGWSSHRVGDSSTAPTSHLPRSSPSNSSASSSSVPGTGVTAAPTPASQSGSGDARVDITARGDGEAGGVVVIPIPPPAPERCSPVHITVQVGQTTLVPCRSANYDGPMSVSVDNPAVASVSTSSGRMLPRYLDVIGRRPGTTIVRVSYPHGPTTSYPITVLLVGT